MKHNQSGQMIIEAILIIVVLLSIALLVSREIRSNDIVSNLVSKPWKSLSGMIQNGSWGPVNSTNSAHPNLHKRHYSFRGEEVN